MRLCIVMAAIVVLILLAVERACEYPQDISMPPDPAVVVAAAHLAAQAQADAAPADRNCKRKFHHDHPHCHHDDLTASAR